MNTHPAKYLYNIYLETGETLDIPASAHNFEENGNILELIKWDDDSEITYKTVAIFRDWKHFTID